MGSPITIWTIRDSSQFVLNEIYDCVKRIVNCDTRVVNCDTKVVNLDIKVVNVDKWVVVQFLIGIRKCMYISKIFLSK